MPLEITWSRAVYPCSRSCAAIMLLGQWMWVKRLKKVSRKRSYTKSFTRRLLPRCRVKVMFSGWQWKAAVWGMPSFSTCRRPMIPRGEGIMKWTTSAQAAAFSNTCRLGMASRIPWLVSRCSTTGKKRICRTAYL